VESIVARNPLLHIASAVRVNFTKKNDTMNITNNTSTENHLSIIKEKISTAEEIFIAVAFLKDSGLKRIETDLKNALERKAKLTIITGLDFYQTEPEALKKLQSLKKSYENCEILIYNQETNKTFHPKLYLFSIKNEHTGIIGSANLTDGGLTRNCELSMNFTFNNESPTYRQLLKEKEQLLQSATVIDDLSLSNYTRKYQIFKKNEKAAKVNVEKQINTIFQLDTKAIEKYLRNYSSNKEEQNNYFLRKQNYLKAYEVLEFIRTENLDNVSFFSNYEKLVGKAGVKSLWHSGSIARGKNKVKENHLEFKTMLNEINANLNKSPKEIFEVTEKYFKSGKKEKINGLGVNIVTEIFNTYAPNKFAVLNQNPLTSIKAFGFESFPHSQSFKSKHYEDFCSLIVSLMNTCEFESLGQTDHFLNFIYWKVKDKLENEKTNPNSKALLNGGLKK
jgi:HKD family nuclease